jgi:hypothetical protein
MKYIVGLCVLALSVICLADAGVSRYWHNENYTPVVLEFHPSWYCAADIHSQVYCWRNM